MLFYLPRERKALSLSVVVLNSRDQPGILWLLAFRTSNNHRKVKQAYTKNANLNALICTAVAT